MTATHAIKQRCELLRSLHVPGRPVLLPNAWDAASARAVVEAGFRVVATTSGGVAAALGFEDHQNAPHEEMFAAARRIAQAVDVPVTVDAEAGYGLGPDAFVAAMLMVGAAGCNLEDTDHDAGGLHDPGEHAAWLLEVRRAATERDYPLVINARVDTFLIDRGAHPPSELLDDAVARSRAYLEAGADCVYPIFLFDAGVIRGFVEAVSGNVNILGMPQMAPPVQELARLGVARISLGSLLQHRAMEQLATYLREEWPASALD